MTAMVFRQIYETQRHSLFRMVSYLAIALPHILKFTDICFPYCTMALCIISAY